MRIARLRPLRGPNVYRRHPLLVLEMVAEESEAASTDNSDLLSRVSEVLGCPSPTQRRPVAAGIEWGIAVEQAIRHLMQTAGIPATYSAITRATPTGCTIVVGYTAEHGTRYLMEAAVTLVAAIARGKDFPSGEAIATACQLVAENELGPSTGAIVDAAEERGIPWLRLSDDSLVQLGYGRRRRLIRAAASDGTSAIGLEVAADKSLTKDLLERASIPVPRGRLVQTPDEAVAALAEMGGPVVVKPLDGQQGKGVSLNLRAPDEVVAAYHVARKLSAGVLVEEMFEGRDYRALVIGGKLVAASHRQPAHVIGDGRHTIAELVEIENADPRRGRGHEKPLTRIRVDGIAEALLARHGRCLNDVPPAGEIVYLREAANLSTGGTAADVTDTVHPEVARMCERVARLIDLDICGVDLVLHDIAQPLQPGNGVIEVNAGPGLRMHLHPSSGQGRPVGRAIVDMLFPPGVPARIPIVSITGTNGKTTTTRMVGHILGYGGQTVGMTTTDGIMIGGEWVTRGDTTGPQSAQIVLTDPSVDVAVLETARGGIVRRGLGYDWSDVGVVTNIQADHIGQDGIESVDDLAHIKALVAERVRPGGTLILNADDRRTARLGSAAWAQDRRAVYFTLRSHSRLVDMHVRAGGTAYRVRRGWLVEVTAAGEERIVPVDAIPVTLGGTARFQVANALAAAAACRALDVPPQMIAAALADFDSAHNPGRANLYRVGCGYVLVDYGHNPEAFAEVAQMAAQWSRRVTGIIAAPGDRADSVITQAGRIAARGFDRIVVREDDDTRGRQRGETAALLCQAVQAERPGLSCHVTLDESESLAEAIHNMTPGECVVFFYDNFDAAEDVLRRFGATPAASIDAVSVGSAA